MVLPTHTQRSRPVRRSPVVAAARLGRTAGEGNGAGGRRGDLRVVDPLDIFTGLAAACVPAFCDGLRVDLATAGGRSVTAGYGSATQGTDGTDARREDRDGRQPGVEVRGERSAGAGRVVIAVQSEPVAGESSITGTITCTWRDSERPTEIDVVVTRLLADQAVANVRIENIATKLQEQRVRMANLEEALTTNREIGQAIGILMAIERLTATQAFERLRIASQHSHRKLRDVAADVSETGRLPQSPGPTRSQARLGLAPPHRSP
jgi:hypothetical protein